MMQSLEAFRGQLNQTQDMLSVVKTMKMLSSVKIRQFERAVNALRVYRETLEDGLHVALRKQEIVPLETTPFIKGNIGAIVFGSEQGLVGQFNEQIANYTLKRLGDFDDDASQRQVLTAGSRVHEHLLEGGQMVSREIRLPGSLEGITPAVQQLLLIIDEWRNQKHVERIILFHNTPTSGASYTPQLHWLFPLNPQWLRDVQERSWDSRSLPIYTMSHEKLFANLVQEYFFVTLYRAFVESLASENASRLASMQAAERNIEDHLNLLQKQYHQRRQTVITEEILDIVSGFEALSD